MYVQLVHIFMRCVYIYNRQGGVHCYHAQRRRYDARSIISRDAGIVHCSCQHCAVVHFLCYVNDPDGWFINRGYWTDDICFTDQVNATTL